MLNIGLKLWSSNHAYFEEATRLYERKKINFVELYHNPDEQLDFASLKRLKALKVTVHNVHDHGFHEFTVDDAQLAIWRETRALADFLNARVIVVHPGKNHTILSFQENLAKIDDSRILIENMAGVDVYGEPMFAQTLAELLEIRRLKDICFDFEKAVKAACFQRIDYKKFIHDCVTKLSPTYFHISGGDKESPTDEHCNLSEATFDIAWIKRIIMSLSKQQSVSLVFETPKDGDALENDIKNIAYFQKYL